MYSTKDYLKESPWQAIINRINEVYLTELNTYTSKLIDLESLGGTRTKVIIDSNRSIDEGNTMPVVTRDEYIYDRLDLSTFFSTPDTVQLSGFTLPTNTFKILDQLSELNDIKFTLNDFVHTQFDEYGRVYALKANSKSLRFVGEINFELINTTKQILGNLGNKLEFPSANDRPLGNVDDKIIGQYTTSGFDFTSEREFIKSLNDKSIWPSGRKLAALMQDITSYPWVCSTSDVEWNIAGKVEFGEARLDVIYNGIVLPRYSPRKDIQRVCVLRLNNLSDNVSGYLLLHYN